MVRRTGGRRAGTGRGRCGRPAGAAGTAVAAAAFSLVVAVPGYTAVAAGTPEPYSFADGARSVTGATSPAGAERLEPGRAYTSSLPAHGKVYYRLDLDDTSSAYVSATAVPRPGTTVAATDGLRVSVQAADGTSCSFQSARFGASHSPHPIAAWGAREVLPGRVLCQGAGTFHVVVERTDARGSSPDDWALELAPVAEPPLERTGASRAPGTWDSASPAPVTGKPVERAGGGGFATASRVGQGVWQARLRPGQTLFYAVPVDWGQQLNALAELGGSSGGRGYVSGALTLSLYNPARGSVADASDGYDGRQASAASPPLPPVAYSNRFGFSDQMKATRFAGCYYLVVHLAGKTAEQFGDGPFELTLRVRLGGAARSGPGYAGQSTPRDLFAVTSRDRAAATADGTGAPDETALRALAVGGIGAGTVLLAGLGVWTAVTRRRARA
ncbi:hypothetical protein ABZ920_10995 [Streptomyces sp. NPDC046831]|uniref:hypothetical protein n=1 Tax=Streptomyces sp. NPDC046831 TaxID=3154805 RepID=UPI0033D9D647